MKVIISSILLFLSFSYSESMENYLTKHLTYQTKGEAFCGVDCKQQKRTKAVYDSLREYSVCDGQFIKTEQLDFVDMYSNAETRDVFVMFLDCFVKMKSVSILPVKDVKEKDWHRLKVQMSYWNDVVNGIVDSYTFFCFTEKKVWPCK